jgi:hypothetical protein
VSELSNAARRAALALAVLATPALVIHAQVPSTQVPSTATQAPPMQVPTMASADTTTAGDTTGLVPAPGRVIPAPPPPSGDRPESVTVVPGAEYFATGVRSLFAGSRYRDLWRTPIRVPVLDLARYAGGLTPLKHGGGSQTVSLHFMGGDGVEYVARSVDKRPVVPAEYKGMIESVVRDETSASLPGAALVVAPLMRAAGLLSVPDPSLVVIPDDPRLGRYRHEFAGMLAEFEVRPKTEEGDEGFAGASQVVKSDKLLADLRRNAGNRVDSREYLKARLMDTYIGDWDRGPSQWRWAGYGESDNRLWKPIALDRDWAMQRSNGALAAVIRTARPELITFDGDLPPLESVMFQERDFDRRLLQDLDWAAFDSTGQALQRALTDSVIDDAVGQLPPEFRAKRGAQLVAWLRARRDKLPKFVRAYYLAIAQGADVHSTAEPTIAELIGRSDTLELRMRRRADPSEAPYYDRRFVGGDTKELRLYLDGGPDSVVVRGGGDGIGTRVITAVDGTVVVDSTAPGAASTRIYDGGHTVQLIDRHHVSEDDTRWTAPPTASVLPGIGGAGQRDVGHSCGFTPRGAASSDIGIGLGFYYTCDEYGFRRPPFAVRQSIGFGYGTGTGGINGSYQIQVRPVESDVLWGLRLYGTSAEWAPYFGLGNNTSLDVGGVPRSINYFQVRENRFSVFPSVTLPLAQGLSLQTGPFLRYWDTGHTAGTLFAVAHPYGAGPFGNLGGLADLRYDTRDAIGLPTRGVFIDVVGRAVPAVWDAQSAYGSVRGQASTYLTPPGVPLEPTLALRVGGMKVWGTAPYQDMAHIGATQSNDDPYTVRGFYPDRFTGDAAAWGNAQLTFIVAHPKILIPSDLGLVLLNDIGRVFLAGEQSNAWHDSYGGGVFVGILRRSVTVVALAAHSSERTLFYIGAGTGL